MGTAIFFFFEKGNSLIQVKYYVVNKCLTVEHIGLSFRIKI